MPYTIHQLAKLAGVSVRTLHHYDQIGLLQPSRSKSNGYRQYEEAELLKLQQILFYRELEFPLEEIKAILKNPRFNMQTALLEHRQLIQMKRKRLDGLLKTIDATLKKLDKQTNMKDEELYEGFDSEQMKKYALEAKERWGNTEAYKQSQERTKQWTKEDYKRVKEDGEQFMQHLVTKMSEGPTSPVVQELIDQHYNSLRTFYEPNLEMYRGLANMYIDDPRFAAYFQKFHPELPEFMKQAMLAYCDKKRS